VQLQGPDRACIDSLPKIVILVALLQAQTSIVVGARNEISFLSDMDHLADLTDASMSGFSEHSDTLPISGSSSSVYASLERGLALAVRRAFGSAENFNSYGNGVCRESEEARISDRHDSSWPDHRLTSNEFSMEGMSGNGNRVLMNILAAEVDAAWRRHSERNSLYYEALSYLEIGSYHGSLLAATICGNRLLRAVSVDDFSEFNGSSAVLRERVRGCEGSATWSGIARGQVDFFRSQFQDAGLDLGPSHQFQLYLYDGPHSEQDHFDSVALMVKKVSKVFVLVVDDWSWKSVRAGTWRAVRELGLEVVFHGFGKGEDWHNGCWVAVVRKP
jgi:hypothetical protein